MCYLAFIKLALNYNSSNACHSALPFGTARAVDAQIYSATREKYTATEPQGWVLQPDHHLHSYCYS